VDFQDEENSNTPFGWKWRWPKERVDDVKSYQALSYGWNPWMPNPTNMILPMRIGAIDELRVDYQATVNASGKYNLSFDFWITERADNIEQNELNVKREFMIWVDRKAAEFDPYWYVGDVTIGGLNTVFIASKTLRERFQAEISWFSLQRKRCLLEASM
jgi:hypothetical protein